MRWAEAMAMPSGKLWRKMAAIIITEASLSLAGDAGPGACGTGVWLWGVTWPSSSIASSPIRMPTPQGTGPHMAMLSGISCKKEMASMVPPAKLSMARSSFSLGRKDTPAKDPRMGPAIEIPKMVSVCVSTAIPPSFILLPRGAGYVTCGGGTNMLE